MSWLPRPSLHQEPARGPHMFSAASRGKLSTTPSSLVAIAVQYHLKAPVYALTADSVLFGASSNPVIIAIMSNPNRSSFHPSLPPQTAPSETVRLFTSDADPAELEIRRDGDTFLTITKKLHRDGHTNPDLEIWHLDLTTTAVIPRYLDPDNTDVTALWNVEVVYGAGGTGPPGGVEYKLLGEHDAFTFQRVVTGYTPSERFKNVTASTLEQHLFKRSTMAEADGEAQLWWSEPPEPIGEPTSPFSSTPTGLSPRARFTPRPASVLSTQSAASARSMSIQTDAKGRELMVSRANPPPLLVLFGRGTVSDEDGNKLHHTWRVNSKL